MSTIDTRPLLAATGNDPFPAFSSRRRQGVRVTTAAAVALGLALTGGGVAGATSSGSGSSAPAASPVLGQSQGSPPIAVGKVHSVGADSFVVSTGNNTSVTVKVSGTTTFTDRGVTSPTLANVTVGVRVAVFGTDDSTTVTATKVSIGVPARVGSKAAPSAGGRGAPPAGSKEGTISSVKSGMGPTGKGGSGGSPPGY